MACVTVTLGGAGLARAVPLGGAALGGAVPSGLLLLEELFAFRRFWLPEIPDLDLFRSRSSLLPLEGGGLLPAGILEFNEVAALLCSSGEAHTDLWHASTACFFVLHPV